jgi:hypothetical protein
MRQFLYNLTSVRAVLLILIFGACGTDLSGYPFKIVAKSLITDDARIDISQKSVNVPANGKTIMDPIRLSVNACNSSNMTGPCNNNWSGPVYVTTVKGETAFQQNCSFSSLSDNSITILRDYGGRLQITCY